MGRITFVLGGARSGKSGHAQRLAEASGGPLLYIATAQALDAEMSERIARHRAERDERWRTLECPLGVPDAIARNGEARTVLVDCLTLWLGNLMLGDHDVAAAGAALADALRDTPAQVVLVANEVGQGIVPDNALARRFRDEAGWLNQRVAASADVVWLLAAGLPLRLKG